MPFVTAVIAVDEGRAVAVVEALAAAKSVVLTQPVAPAPSLQSVAPYATQTQALPAVAVVPVQPDEVATAPEQALSTALEEFKQV